MKSLSVLISETWDFFQKHFAVFLIGAAIFGLLNGVIVHELYATAGKNVTQMMGIDSGRFQELSRRAAQGDTEAVNELNALSKEWGESMAGSTPEAKEAMKAAIGMNVLAHVFPMFGIGIVLSILVSIVAMAFYSVIAVKGTSDVSKAFQEALPLIFPLTALGIWSALRSFIWIPLIGFVFGIIFGPRFVMGPLLLIRDGKGVMDSASESYKRTAGLWGKIFGNLVAVGIITGILNGVIAKILSIGGFVGLWISFVVQQGFIAFTVAFSVMLAKTILDNTKKVA